MIVLKTAEMVPSKNIIKIKIFGEDADNCLVQKVL